MLPLGEKVQVDADQFKELNDELSAFTARNIPVFLEKLVDLGFSLAPVAD